MGSEMCIRDRNITFDLTPAAGLCLAKEGFDPVYGARPLRRAVQRHLENCLSKKILAGELQEGDHVEVDANDDSGLTLTTRELAAQTA